MQTLSIFPAMNLAQKIAVARKRKGLTQEELAEQSGVTVRTIQRIETGETSPRMFTIKALAAALDLSYEDLQEEIAVPAESKINWGEANTNPVTPAVDPAESKHYLQLLCLSCFTFLLIPLIHFLIPAYLLRKWKSRLGAEVAMARKIVRRQIIQVIVVTLAMLLTVCWNIVQVRYFGQQWIIHPAIPAAILYFFNAVQLLLILRSIRMSGK